MKKSTGKSKQPEKAKQPEKPKQPEMKGGDRQQFAASGEGKQYGEGNYAATRQYNAGLKEHMQTHDIEREARDAAPRSPEESKEMSEAERIGRSRSKGTPGKKVK